MKKKKQKEADKLCDVEEIIRLSQTWEKPTEPASPNAQWYSYHFQCWGCLAMHEGEMQSDNQLLAIECLEPMTHEEGGAAPSLFALLGEHRTCGKVNHTFGRKIKKRIQ
jgi:hypothetical protein